MNTTTFGGVKITWLGHASIMLEYRAMTVYVDPYVLPPNPKKASLILYTHSHFDHCAEAHSITGPNTVIIGYNCKIPSRPIEIGQKYSSGQLTIEAVHAYNIGKPFHPKGFGAGFIISFGKMPQQTRVYVAGDTDLIPEMADIKCDVAMVPIGGKYTMAEKEAAKAIAQIKPKLAIPIHFNYLSDTKADPELFRKLVSELYPSCNVRILV